MPVQVQCTMLDAWGWCTGKTQRDGMGREEGGGLKRKKKKKILLKSSGKQNMIVKKKIKKNKNWLAVYISAED